MNKIEILQLSVRSMNGLKSDRIYYIEDLIVLSEQHLLKLPCLGVKSINEIKNALNQIGLGLGMNPDDIEADGLAIDIAQTSSDDIEMWLNAIASTEFKKTRLVNSTNTKIANLSTRSRNALNIEIKNHSDTIGFLKHLFVLPSLFYLPNIGKTSESEIQELSIKIRKEIEGLYYSKETTIEISFDLMPLIGISEKLIEEYRKECQDDGVHIFRIIDFLITKRFNERELTILKSRNNFWNKDQLTLQELGLKLGVTRERIRQIETKTNRKLWIIIEALFPCCHLIDLSQYYELDCDFINDVSAINAKDNTNFSDYFLYKTLSILLGNDYQEIIDTTKKCQYLVSKAIGETFNFIGFIEKIEFLLSSNTNDDYQLTLKGLQYKYYKSDKFDDDVINRICEDLLYSEFNIIPDSDNNITIKSKAPRSIESYIEEALISNNKPTHLNDLYKAIKNTYPEFSQSIRYVGNAMIGNDKFIFFDRNSTYGLKIWEGKLTQNSVLIDIVRPNQTRIGRSGIKVWNENSKVIVRGGTMIDIVIDYLKEFQEPQHIDDIFIEVDKWRETNKNRLMGNLKVNNRDCFVIENRHVGLLNE